ncbi:hypothetical protein AVEN_198752-1, partial [Araneus ventricosus]
DIVEESVDLWWRDVENTSKYPLLSRMTFALLTCFHEPKVESSFSIMNNVITPGSMTTPALPPCPPLPNFALGDLPTQTDIYANDISSLSRNPVLLFYPTDYTEALEKGTPLASTEQPYPSLPSTFPCVSTYPATFGQYAPTLCQPPPLTSPVQREGKIVFS